MHLYNDLDLNNQKILWLPSIFEFERKLGFSTTLPHMISKILFALGANKFLELMEGPSVAFVFLKVQMNLRVLVKNIADCCIFGPSGSQLKTPQPL